MKHLNIFLLFPDTDDEIITLCSSPANITAVAKEIRNVKELAKKETDSFDWFYDAKNLEQFESKSKSLTDGVYLDKPVTQIRTFFGKQAINICCAKIHKSDCQYFWWNIASCTAEEAYMVIKCAFEKMGEKEATTVVFSLTGGDRFRRDIIPVIKDAPHYEECPVFYSLPVFETYEGLVEWFHHQSISDSISLRDVKRFKRTNLIYRAGKQRIYQELKTNYYWYFDYFHRENKMHYEVFDSFKKHLGEADMKGQIDRTRQDPQKTIDI